MEVNPPQSWPWKQSGSCDDCQSCEQLKKRAKDKYFEKKLDFEP